MILSNICAEMLKIFLRNKKIKEAAVLARITAARETPTATQNTTQYLTDNIGLVYLGY